MKKVRPMQTGMTAEQARLCEDLMKFEIGGRSRGQAFRRRLERETGWSPHFCERAIHEYKRFVFLACAGGPPVSPSEAVDEAWHLHLLYTESYWNELCGGLLGRPLHHAPSRGGSDEESKFRDWYQDTLDSYARLFGESPPSDIWPTGNGPAPEADDTAPRLKAPARRGRGRRILAGAAVILASVLGAGLQHAVAQGSGDSSAATWAFPIGLVALVVVLLIVAARRAGSRSQSGSGYSCSTVGTGSCGASGGGNSHSASSGHCGHGGHGGDSGHCGGHACSGHSCGGHGCGGHGCGSGCGGGCGGH